MPKPPATPAVAIQVRLPVDLNRRLRERADREAASLSALVIQALEQYLGE